MTEDIKLQTDELPENISAALDKLLANPQIISMVASALGGASPPKAQADSAPVMAEQTEPQENTVPASAAALPSLDKLLPLIGKLSQTSSRSSSFKHEQLLCAIKPYLSPSRCQAIDQIIRISKMSAIIGQLKP